MGFATAGFLGFLAVVAALHALAPRGARPLLLTVASIVFYWTWSGLFAVLLVGASLLAFFAARSRSLALGVVALLFAVLVLFKSLPLLGANAWMPLGVSYYTFKLAGYLIDVYWGAVEPERRLLPFLAYTAFFPQIVAGPIQRAQAFLPQAERAARPTGAMVVRGTARILLGFFKKYVVADNIGQIVNYVYAHLGAHPGAPVLLGFYGYPLQMYADFSALTDIAIGAGLLLGIEAPENFNAPFTAASPSEYWRRWHISLTLWMTDYVFTPLRMALRGLGNAGLVLSLFINMILIGLWHGFYLTYALFGAVHAVYLSVDALTQKWRKRLYKRNPGLDRATDWLGPIVTFHLIAVAFVFFRASSLQAVGAMLGHLFDGLESWSPDFLALFQPPGTPLAVISAAWVAAEIGDALRRRYWPPAAPLSLPRWARWSACACTAIAAIFTLCLLLTRVGDTSPFLYAIF